MLIVLLDANAIIGFHELGAWGQIIKQHEVYIPSIVLRNEAFFYRTVDGRRHPIDLLLSVGKSITHLLQWLKYSALKSAGYRQGREAWHYSSTGEL